MDFIAQVNLGLSKRFWTIRFKKVNYKQKTFLRKNVGPEMFKTRPPHRIPEYFLYHSESFLAMRFTRSLQIFRECRILKKIV